ncbi:hypothetical protein B296_00013503 [Ensete ventricosum]|uniref:Uncharacterized protein n=1 Tax=Ensete ventricosum TaxID=4639 RepID=A0A427AMJ0_ENSVE|nr:hypothetical protein B296_00013503 [Ensete ventricosum]
MTRGFEGQGGVPGSPGRSRDGPRELGDAVAGEFCLSLFSWCFLAFFGWMIMLFLYSFIQLNRVVNDPRTAGVIGDRGSSSREMRRELAEGIGSLLGWRKGVCRKKVETRRKIVRVAERLARSWEGLEVELWLC